jgi:hypothetical protein
LPPGVLPVTPPWETPWLNEPPRPSIPLPDHRVTGNPWPAALGCLRPTAHAAAPAPIVPCQGPGQKPLIPRRLRDASAGPPAGSVSTALLHRRHRHHRWRRTQGRRSDR